MFRWLKSKFKSRAQRDRESGYYTALPRVGSAHKDPAEQLAELLAEANRAGVDRTRIPAPAPRIRPSTPWARFATFYRAYGIPNPKQALALLFPSEWLMEKLWPRWDPTDKNAQVAPEAGYYDSETGRVYDSKHRLIRTRNPGA